MNKAEKARQETFKAKAILEEQKRQEEIERRKKEEERFKEIHKKVVTTTLPYIYQEIDKAVKQGLFSISYTEYYKAELIDIMKPILQEEGFKVDVNFFRGDSEYPDYHLLSICWD